MEKYGVVQSWFKLPLVYEVSQVVSLHLPEDSLLKLECDQLVLLVSNEKEAKMYKYTVESAFTDPNQFGMTCGDSLVSLFLRQKKNFIKTRYRAEQSPPNKQDET